MAGKQSSGAGSRRNPDKYYFGPTENDEKLVMSLQKLRDDDLTMTLEPPVSPPYGHLALYTARKVLRDLRAGKRNALDHFMTFINMEDRKEPLESELMMTFHMSQTLCEIGLHEIFSMLMAEQALLHIHTLICCFDYCLATSAAVKYVLRMKGEGSWIRQLVAMFTGMLQTHFVTPENESTFILGIMSRILHIFTKCVAYYKYSGELQDLLTHVLIIRTIECDIERQLKADPVFRTTEKGRRTFMIKTQMHALNDSMSAIGSGSVRRFGHGTGHDRVRVCNPGMRYYVFCSNPVCNFIGVRDNHIPHCGRCLLARYCHRTCQQQHWGKHKKYCRLA